MKKRRQSGSRPPRSLPSRRLPLSKTKILAGSLIATGILGVTILLLVLGGSEPSEKRTFKPVRETPSDVEAVGAALGEPPSSPPRKAKPVLTQKVTLLVPRRDP